MAKKGKKKLTPAQKERKNSTNGIFLHVKIIEHNVVKFGISSQMWGYTET